MVRSNESEACRIESRSVSASIRLLVPRHRMQATPALEQLQGVFSLDYLARELGTKLMEDTSVDEIMINAPNEIYIGDRKMIRDWL